ncbi:MAG: DUF2202 domain-containing protein [Ignavibacteria bacterium]|nr:DUF2202 domain-containing protein [Ignavibacteria bacterium]
MKKISGIIWLLLLSSIFSYSSGTNDKNEYKDNRDLFLKLYQEEKMVYDLLGEFHERWSLSVFYSVQQREARHVWCVERIMDNYGYNYKTNSNTGSYQDKEIQKIYDELTVKGCISDLAALEAAAFIKEKYIYQLRQRIRYQEDGYVVKVIFLMESAAQSHLRAFVNSIKLSGSEYTPQFFTDEEFSSIIERN